MINVTKPFFPPKEEYYKILDGVWKRGWLTNNGPLLTQLEEKLCEFLGVENLVALGNGTISLQIAFKALRLSGEVITTPFSYVATTSSIKWAKLTPVFADIDPATFCINPANIEAHITPKTSAILATHVFGVPCNVEAIKSIADKHGLKVIYDGAHAFGVRYKGKSVLNYGDLNSLSFHATKLYHTVEGGALVSTNKTLVRRTKRMRNFGHSGPEKFDGIGINGKMSELHAAMGLLNLNYIAAILQKRKDQFARYRSLLQSEKLQFQEIPEGTDHNCSYMPVVFETERKALEIIDVLKKHKIFPRRYFYPSLSRLPYVDADPMNISDSISRRILCLPLYHDLKDRDIDKISSLIMSNL